MNTKPRINPDVAQRRQKRQVMIAMCFYAVLLLSCVYLIKHAAPTPSLKVVLALIPTLPVIWVMWSLYVFLEHADELQRRVHLTSLSLAAGVTAFLTLTYGFLEDFAGFPHIPAWWTFVIIDMVWGASSCVLWCRYK
ncbi:MAG TPA: hypothetical protein VGM47_09795 [Gammaproteobacteria bacterium]|jgi:hypothetical protein